MSEATGTAAQARQLAEAKAGTRTRRRPWAAIGRGLLRFVQEWWTILIILIAWPTWILVNGFTQTVAPLPWAVVADFFVNFGDYIGPILWTVMLAVVGLAIGVVLGIVAGVFVWMSPLVSGLVVPSALILRVVPVTAMIPVLARIFGYGTMPVMAMIVIILFFPAFTLTISGMSQTAASGRDLFRVLGAGIWMRVIRLHLPGALPNIMLALRISAPLAILAVLLCEYILGGNGLGHMLDAATDLSQTDRAWGAACVATVLSVSCFGLARLAERKVIDRVT